MASFSKTSGPTMDAAASAAAATTALSTHGSAAADAKIKAEVSLCCLLFLCTRLSLAWFPLPSRPSCWVVGANFAVAYDKGSAAAAAVKTTAAEAAAECVSFSASFVVVGVQEAAAAKEALEAAAVMAAAAGAEIRRQRHSTGSGRERTLSTNFPRSVITV
jgi:hypothetical protein